MKADLPKSRFYTCKNCSGRGFICRIVFFKIKCKSCQGEGATKRIAVFGNRIASLRHGLEDLQSKIITASPAFPSDRSFPRSARARKMRLP